MRISDWSSDVCSSDLGYPALARYPVVRARMNWLVLAGSLVAILALAGIARLLRLGRDGKVEDAGAAAPAAEDALAGFRAAGALVSDDDLAATVAGDDRSEESTSELPSLTRIHYSGFRL